MLLSKSVKIKWNAKIKTHYMNLGYKYTKMSDEFEVNINDLTDGSSVLVDVKCDYCNQTYQKHWYNYLQENIRSNIHKDSCNKCKSLKAKESVINSYGCENVFQLENVKVKISETNIQKYGVENPFQSEEIKKKIKDKNIEKYGYESAMQSSELKEKRRLFCIEKYGLPYMPQLNIAHQKGSLSPRWNGGALRNGLFRSTYQYQDWRDAVFKRDNYTCQCCADTNGNGHTVKFNIHHIFNFADNENLRYDINNGICLCKQCHRQYHHLYGYKNTTQLQLDEFILNYGKKIC